MAAAERSNLRLIEAKKDTDLDLSSDELEALIHALQKDYDEIERAGGNRYGTISLDHLFMLIARLRKAYASCTLKQAKV